MSRPRLAVVSFPVEGEHPAGYVRRLAMANGIDNLRPMRTMFGITPPSPLSGPQVWRNLAEATGIDTSRMQLLRWPRIGRTGESWLSVSGHAVRQTHLDLRHLKHCPVCIAEDGVVRSEWSLRHVTACPRHRLLLNDTCPTCGWSISLRERTHVWHCGDCGSDLATGGDRAGDAHVLLSAAIIASMHGNGATCHGDLPSGFLELPTSDMAAVLDLLAEIGAPDEKMPTDGRRVPPPPLPEARLRLERAAVLLHDWPSRFAASLTDLDAVEHARTRVGSSMRQFGGPTGRLLARIPLTRSGTPIAFVADVVAGTLDDTAGYRAGQRAPTSRSRSGARVAQPSATVPISFADAMKRLEGRPDGRLARWWIDAGLLAELRPSTDRAALCTDEVSMLVESVRFVADDRPRADPVDIAWVDRSVTCRDEYDKSEFLLDLLDGRIEAWIAVPDFEGLSALRFSRSSVLRRAALATLRAWMMDDAHVSMFRFRQVARKVWRDEHVPGTAETHLLAEAGRVAFVHYHPPGEGRRQRRWHVGDLVTEIQRGSGEIHIDPAA